MPLRSAVEREWTWPFWSVLLLCIPSFAALLITISALLRPNMWAYTLVPLLYFYIPVSFVVAVAIAAITRRSMRYRWSRNTWVTLALSLFAVLLTVMLLMWAGGRTY